MPSREDTSPTIGPQVVFSYDPSGEITLSVGTGLASLGLQPGQLVGQNVFEVYREDAAALDHLQRALGGESLTVERPFLDRRVSVYYQPLFDDQGKVLSVLGVSTDVTEQRRLEQEAADARRRTDLLADLSAALTRAVPDVLSILGVAARTATDGVGDVCAIWLCTPGLSRPALSSVWHPDPTERRRAEAWLAEQAEHTDPTRSERTQPPDDVALVLDLRGDGEGNLWHEEVLRRWARHFGFTAVVSVPLWSRGHLIGALDLGRTTDRPLTDAEVGFVRSVAERCGVAVDNAALLNDQRAAREELVKFQALADASIDLISITDESGAFAYANPRVLSSGIELRPDVWATAELYGPVSLAEAARTTLETEGRWSGDVSFTVDGRELFMSLDAFRLFHPESQAALGTAWISHDITELRATEAALRAANTDLKKFKALVEASPDFIAIAGLDGSVQYVNPPGRRLVGMNPELDVTTTRISDYLTPEGLEASIEIEQPAVVAHGRWEGESTLRHHGGGKPIPVAISSFLMRDAETGEPFALATVQRDITERRAAEAALRHLMEQREGLLRRLVDAQDAERVRIAADVHDDPVQVLAAVDLRLGLLKRQLREHAPQLLESMEPLQTSVSAATDRLRALLFDLEPPDLHSGLAAALSRAAEEIFDVSETWWTVVGDEPDVPDATRAVAYRIATEAMINVRKHARARHVTVAVTGRDGGLEVSVTDDGIGLGKRPLRSSPGHRGLVGMQDRATVAGGHCSIENATDKGTRLTVWLPGVTGHGAPPTGT